MALWVVHMSSRGGQGTFCQILAWSPEVSIFGSPDRSGPGSKNGQKFNFFFNLKNWKFVTLNHVSYHLKGAQVVFQYPTEHLRRLGQMAFSGPNLLTSCPWRSLKKALMALRVVQISSGGGQDSFPQILAWLPVVPIFGCCDRSGPGSKNGQKFNLL